METNKIPDANVASSVDEGKFKFYSIGIVAANKNLDSHIIEVTPIEKLSNIDGEISDNKKDYNAKGVDASGAAFEKDIDTTASIKAKWLPIASTNRKTSPDVRRGEKVFIYKFADADEYFWVDAFQDNKLRRLETVVWSFSNNSKEGIEDKDDSTYYIEVSTHKKIFHLHTSKNDGEPFSYDLQINAKAGTILLTDDTGNSFSLDSGQRHWQLKNVDGSVLDINKADISMSCPGNFSVRAGGDISHVSGGNNTATSGRANNIDASSHGVSSGSMTHNGSNVGSSHTHTGVHGETSPPH